MQLLIWLEKSLTRSKKALKISLFNWLITTLKDNKHQLMNLNSRMNPLLKTQTSLASHMVPSALLLSSKHLLFKPSPRKATAILPLLLECSLQVSFLWSQSSSFSHWERPRKSLPSNTSSEEETSERKEASKWLRRKLFPLIRTAPSSSTPTMRRSFEL